MTDVTHDMNRALGIGAGLNVDDNQRFENLRAAHLRDADADAAADAAAEQAAQSAPAHRPAHRPFTPPG